MDFVIGAGDAPCAPLPDSSGTSHRMLIETSVLASDDDSKSAQSGRHRRNANNFLSTVGNSHASDDSDSLKGNGTLVMSLRHRPQTSTETASGTRTSESEENAESRQPGQNPNDDVPEVDAGKLQAKNLAQARTLKQARSLEHARYLKQARSLKGAKDPRQRWPRPLFSFDTAETHSDLIFPDYTYWGHEHEVLLGAPVSTHLLCGERDAKA